MNYIAYAILAVFAFFINYFFSNIGVYPIDTFSFFDSGYLITKGYHPIKDFWVISGILVDYIQALFFLIFQDYFLISNLVSFQFMPYLFSSLRLRDQNVSIISRSLNLSQLLEKKEIILLIVCLCI